MMTKGLGKPFGKQRERQASRAADGMVSDHSDVGRLVKLTDEQIANAPRWVRRSRQLRRQL